MLAYRHLFHAGNFADVFKHALLAQLVLELHKKDKPIFVLDTHAGIGRYDLTHAWAQKNAEFRDGIAKIWRRPNAPTEIRPYLDAVVAENADGELHFYPGSPRIVRRLLRPGDRLVLGELNKKDCEELHAWYARDRQVRVELADGYQLLKAHLPPKERRGLIFVDSSFDRSKEFDRLTQGFVEAHRKFATGIYALWYPLMEPMTMRAFERGVQESGIRKILQVELSLFPDSWTANLRGCGMLIANPPFAFEVTARRILDWVWPALSGDREGGVRVRWLVDE